MAKTKESKVMEKNPKFNLLFSGAKEKAEAFDKIAEAYYNRNFGSISKSDFDVLMFSIYIERLLEQNESDMESYSDYELSKQLGITQSKIKNLKVKKELLYPYEDFKWENSFSRVCENARFEDGKIHININDPNLFIELKHFVELRNGRVDIQLNSNSFVISVDMFFELLVYIGKEEDKKIILKSIKETYQKNEIEIKNIEKASLSKTIKENAAKVGGKILINGIKECAYQLTSPLSKIVKCIAEAVNNS